MTPESPLRESLIQSGKTVRHLKICLDVSGAFGNFDKLWIALTNKMEVLETLDIEPYPQVSSTNEQSRWMLSRLLGTNKPELVAQLHAHSAIELTRLLAKWFSHLLHCVLSFAVAAWVLVSATMTCNPNQQNTAPSFQAFVESCPKLLQINGRRIDQLPPCFTPFDPDNRTSALAY